MEKHAHRSAYPSKCLRAPVRSLQPLLMALKVIQISNRVYILISFEERWIGDTVTTVTALHYTARKQSSNSGTRVGLVVLQLYAFLSSLLL